MDLIDELLERDAGTVNSTIIGKPLDSFGKNSKAMKKKKSYLFEYQCKIFEPLYTCCRIELLKWPRKPKKGVFDLSVFLY